MAEISKDEKARDALTEIRVAEREREREREDGGRKEGRKEAGNETWM